MASRETIQRIHDNAYRILLNEAHRLSDDYAARADDLEAQSAIANAYEAAARQLAHSARQSLKDATRQAKTEELPPGVTVERMPDWQESGEYLVTFPNGSTTKIYRSEGQWYEVGPWHWSEGYRGNTRKEAIEALARRPKHSR